MAFYKQFWWNWKTETSQKDLFFSFDSSCQDLTILKLNREKFQFDICNDKSANYKTRSMKMAGENDPRKDQENDEISQRNGNLHAPPIDDNITESDEENSSDENERSGYELLPQNDFSNLQDEDNELDDEDNQTLDDILR